MTQKNRNIADGRVYLFSITHYNNYRIDYSMASFLYDLFDFPSFYAKRFDASSFLFFV